ncbi:MAG: DUF4411 family protein [Chloroflexi bacterium]|nr:DUF4411 family protein [Chloroflexota bacterium]MCI0781581.1 DUF4411 family protein [Chloroflexota bacterium]MCI0786502.1 DUF4411 family protein [Chloroflexota bacterium]MCI0799698.1 DUF4411 family protein [Chloroflexota bacterium]MCI0859736.1 DUF4411 family protein [Chloroflexota bacterium]
MADFWLDAGVFIRPNRDGFYSLQLVPTFWQMLVQKAAEGTLASPMRVYQEIADYGDNLSAWANDHRDSGLFVVADQNVQAKFTQVADYVTQNYSGHKAQEFLGGADPWVIAHALADNSTIVGYESRVDISSQTPKIPNVAQAFQIRTVSLYQMIQTLGVVLEFRG